MTTRRVPVRLQEGKRYLCADGDEVLVKATAAPPWRTCGLGFMDESGIYYLADGTCPHIAGRDIIRPVYTVGETYVTETGGVVSITHRIDGSLFPLRNGHIGGYMDDGRWVSVFDDKRNLADYLRAPRVENCRATNVHAMGVVVGGEREPECLAARQAGVHHQTKAGGPTMPTLKKVETADFQVGDRIMVVDIGGGWPADKGAAGVIRAVGGHYYSVQFASYLRGLGHNCGGACENNGGWYLKAEEMRLIGRPEPSAPVVCEDEDFVLLKDAPMTCEQSCPSMLTPEDKALIWDAFKTAMESETVEHWDQAMDIIINQRRKLNAA